MIGSLAILPPALLAWLGDRVEKGRISLLGRHPGPGRRGRIWHEARGGHHLTKCGPGSQRLA
jgi:hypothetical protein